MAAVPLHTVILSGARDVLCELRGNRRFGYLPSFVAATPSEHPLVDDIKRLRDVVRAARPGSGPFPPDALAQALDPFFRIVTSRDTSGNITGVALSALDRVATSMLMSPQRTLTAYMPMLGAMVSAAAGCRFDASDPAKDEVVLAKITRLIARIVSCPQAVVLLSDKSILQGFEACLDIAAGRRRTSELLKRTADAALVDIATVLASTIPAAVDGAEGSVHEPPKFNKHELLMFETRKDASLSAASIDRYLLGGSYGAPFDLASHAQRGPASIECLAAIFELVCKMSDPALPRSAAARMLGLHLVSAILSGGGERLRSHPRLRRLLIRECSRAVLRAVGSFSEPPAFISAAFSVASQLGHALGSDGTAFMSALLQKVFPYYISGYEGVAPKQSPMIEVGTMFPEGATHGTGDVNGAASGATGRGAVGGTIVGNGGVAVAAGGGSANANGVEGGPGVGPSGGSGSDGEMTDADGSSTATEIDAVVRELGLEALCSFVSTPGLLSAMYQVADCSLGCGDVATSLLLSLGGATNSRLFRRRGKRLRASTGGSLSSGNIVADVDSDEDEDDRNGSVGGSAERARHARGAAIICAESLMTVVDTISERMRQRGDSGSDVSGAAGNGNGSGTVEERDVTEGLRAQRVKKRRLQVTADTFNDPSFSASNATKVLKLLTQHGQLGDTSSATNVAEDRATEVMAVVRFLRETPGLNKGKIGTVLGEPDKFSQSVLGAYTNTFYFEDRPFTECLRIFLESFRLPGESQKIDRIVESFADRFYDENRTDSVSRVQGAGGNEAGDGLNTTETSGGLTQAESSNESSTRNEVIGSQGASGASVSRSRSSRGVFANSEAVYTLSFAVVMLNTDQHNPSIRKKMNLEEFVRNTRGINDKKDLPRWFLAEIFESIAAVEIRMSDEAGMGALTDLHWDEQLRDMAQHGLAMPNTSSSSRFDEDIFMISWASCISAATVVFNEASDAGAVQRALEGLLSVARCGASFRRSEPTDAVVSVLTVATSVREGPLFGATVRFGTDIKAQMASVALSGVSRQCGDWMRGEGWMSLVAYVLRLHALCLLPDTMEENLGGYGSDLTGVDGSLLPPSELTPSWWPSQLRRAARLRADADKAVSKTSPPKKALKTNGFFALIAATIGADADSDDGYDSEEDEVYHDAVPSYLKIRTAEDAEAEDLARKCVSACRIDDVLINEAKVLRSEALSCLAQSLARAANEVLNGPGSDGGPAVSGVDASDEQAADYSGDRVGRSVPENGAVSDGSVAGGMGNRKVGGTIGPTGNGDSSDKTFVGPPGDSSIIAGTARVIRSSGSSVESDVDLNGFGSSPSWTGAMREKDERKARASVVAFCIDALCELTLQNRDRLLIPWPALHNILLRVIDPSTRSLALLERAVVALLRVANRLLHRTEIHSDVLRGLNLIVNLPPKTAAELSVPLSAGVFNVVKTYGSHVSSVSGWHALLSIIENCARFPAVSRNIGFQSLSFLLTDDPSFEAVSRETFAPLMDAVLAYTACPSVDVSMKALDLLFALAQRIPKLSEDNKDSEMSDSPEASTGSVSGDRPWAEYWGPLLRGFTTASRDPRGKVRNSALSVLENVVASGGPAGHLTASQWHSALSTTLLPLMNDLFTSHGLLRVTLEAERSAQKKLMDERNAAAAEATPRGRGSRTSVITPEHDAQLLKTVAAACDRTRLRAVMLISKTFLQHHACMADGLSSSLFTEIWLGVLGSFKHALQGGRRERGIPAQSVGDEIREHVPESVKNILLVLCASGLLDKESDDYRWQETFRVLDKCLPEMELESFVIKATSPPSPAPTPQVKQENSEEPVDPDPSDPANSVSTGAVGGEGETNADVDPGCIELDRSAADPGPAPESGSAPESASVDVVGTAVPEGVQPPDTSRRDDVPQLVPAATVATAE